MRAALVALVLLATGCSSTHSARPSGRPVSDGAALRGGTLAREQWEREIRSRAVEAPREHFANLSPDTLRKRLAEAARSHGFQIVAVKLLRPKELAPEISVRTAHDLALARALPAILRSVDPHRGRADTRGWSYEGFFLEARDERGVPFLAVFNYWRGQHKGGGQWARSEALYPFLHG
jgi:hypothetical protein